jgi:heme/copper-type cytochrome/quinol oxidase subunit 3
MILEIIVRGSEDETKAPHIDFLYDGMEMVHKHSSASSTEKDDDEEAMLAALSEHDVLKNVFQSSNPNLSLNKGIKRPAQHWFIAAAVLGLSFVLGELSEEINALSSCY